MPKHRSPNTVVLHQMGRGPWAPSLSPFPLKLETYLRMARIDHENEHSFFNRSSKGKIPYITLNRKEIADSSFIIEHLNKKFNIELNKHLTPEQRGIARAFQKMVEENLYWAVTLQRWKYTTPAETQLLKKQAKFNSFLIWATGKLVSRQASGHGIGRHSYEELMSIMEMDMRALSSFLGSKPYLMGDEACEEDCAVFGMLAQALYHGPDTPMQKLMKEELTNLVDYCERMKQQYWPDWDDCITHGGTREAKA